MKKKYAAFTLAGLMLWCVSDISAMSRSNLSVSAPRPDAIRIIGIVMALGGAGACAFKGSKVIGPTMCVAGLAAALGSDRLIEIFDQQTNQGGFVTRMLRAAKRDVVVLQKN